MDKRTFIKTAGLGLAAMATSPYSIALDANNTGAAPKNWIWLRPQAGKTLHFWKTQLEKMKTNCIDAVLPEVYNSNNAWFETSRLPMR